MSCLERAQFATTARLISSLVIESLVAAFYLPISHNDKSATGFAVILTTEESAHVDIVDNILCIIPLHHPPIFKDEESISLGKKIGLLDPLDMIPMSFVMGRKSVSEVGFLYIIELWQMLIRLTSSFNYRKTMV